MTEHEYTGEISLVDLLAVVIRYRRIIVIPLISAVILAVIAVLFIPEYRYKKDPGNNTYNAVMTCRLTPGVYSFLEEQNPSGLVLPALNDPGVMQAAINETEAADGVKPNITNYNVQKIEVKRDELLNEEYIVSVDMVDDFYADIFIRNLLTAANNYLQETVKPLAEAEIYSYEKIASIEYPRAVIEENLVDTIKRYSAAGRFLAGEEAALYFVQLPYVKNIAVSIDSFRRGIIKNAVIILVVLLILLVFLAFCVNWIDNVRHDPESVKKLHAAVKRERVE